MAAWKREEEGAGAEARAQRERREALREGLRDWYGPQVHRESVAGEPGAAVDMKVAQGRDVVKVRRRGVAAPVTDVLHFNDPEHVADDTTGTALHHAQAAPRPPFPPPGSAHPSLPR